ncbi:hypothetical protein CRYUN_Cryun06bG0023800 [Craigia yunnanensis]
MATTPSNIQTCYHARSNSFPSRSHPLSSEVDEHLNVCTTAKDALLQVKECTLDLQSILRRKRGVKTELAIEVRKYLTSRKAAKKAILKALKNLKHKENKQRTVYNETRAMISLLREVQAVTLNVLESLLSFTFGPDKESKMSRWSLV